MISGGGNVWKGSTPAVPGAKIERPGFSQVAHLAAAERRAAVKSAMRAIASVAGDGRAGPSSPISDVFPSRLTVAVAARKPNLDLCEIIDGILQIRNDTRHSRTVASIISNCL
jgi:hypothetical protein